MGLLHQPRDGFIERGLQLMLVGSILVRDGGEQVRTQMACSSFLVWSLWE
jgi:hypothetical protein